MITIMCEGVHLSGQKEDPGFAIVDSRLVEVLGVFYVLSKSLLQCCTVRDYRGTLGVQLYLDSCMHSDRCERVFHSVVSHCIHRCVALTILSVH